MRTRGNRLYRYWRYFRDGYNLGFSTPIGILNFLTLTFYILMDRVPFLKMIFPHFVVFALVALVSVGPVSVLIGWWNMKRGPYATEAILAVESNPQAAYQTVIGYENMFAMRKALGLPITAELQALYEFYKRLDEKKRWRP